MELTILRLLLIGAAASQLVNFARSEPLCYVEWSISNSYTVASTDSSYVTLNLYASNGGTDDIEAPYNLTIFNPAYIDAFSWNFDVVDSLEGIIYGVTQPTNAFWETLLAGSKNVVNMGGNVETSELGVGPLRITIGGFECVLRERLEGNKFGTPGAAGGGSDGSGGGGDGSAGNPDNSGGGGGGSNGGGSGSDGTATPAPAPGVTQRQGIAPASV